MRSLTTGFRIAAAAVFIFLAASVSASPQTSKTGIDVEQLVRRAAENEIKANVSHVYFMYRDHIQWKTHSVTKEIIETPQGGLASTIDQNGAPLTPEQRAKEDQKLSKFAYDAETRQQHEETSKKDDERAASMLTSLPDAFLYTYAGTERGPDGNELVHLTFKPNPKFNPPNHETMVYLGMQGDMLIDPKAERIAKLDGTLFRDVDFGWGILGKLYKGGKFIIEQRDVGAGKWEMTRERLQFEGRILLVKGLHIESDETMTEFHQVPGNLTVAQQLETLHKGTETLANNAGGPTGGTRNRK